MQIKKDNGIDRREFLKRLGAGTIVTTTALAGCKSDGAAAATAACAGRRAKAPTAATKSIRRR